MNIYGQAREERLWTVVEQVAQAIRVISVSRPESAITVDDTKALIYEKIQTTGEVEAAGIEPASESLQLQPLHMLFQGRDSALPTSPVGQEGCLPGLSFACSSSRRGRMEAIPHRDALHHHRGRVMGGRWPVVRRPGLLHNRWRLCGFPLFYEASGVLGMQP